MENKAMREEHERLWHRCLENLLVMKALNEVFGACVDLLLAMQQVMADMEGEDE